MILNFGIMLLLARLSTLLPDVSRMVPFVSRLLMYGSGVIFPITRFTDNYPALHAIIQLNPLYVLLTMYRQVIIEGDAAGVELGDARRVCSVPDDCRRHCLLARRGVVRP